jgi:hypothetical protein
MPADPNFWLIVQPMIFWHGGIYESTMLKTDKCRSWDFHRRGHTVAFEKRACKTLDASIAPCHLQLIILP